MDLQISCCLLLVLFTAGHSLKCFQCRDTSGLCTEEDLVTCASGVLQCTSAMSAQNIGGVISVQRDKGCASTCETVSMNIGIEKISSMCCDTDSCNTDFPVPGAPNGLSCNICDGLDCSHTVMCSGTEDRCIKATGTYGSQTSTVKGCISNFFCQGIPMLPSLDGISCCERNLCNGVTTTTGAPSTTPNVTPSTATDVTPSTSPKVNPSTTLDVTPSTTQSSASTQNVTQSANGAESSQSFLILCCSLLSFILLH